jgi:hypothetical protein
LELYNVLLQKVKSFKFNNAREKNSRCKFLWRGYLFFENQWSLYS